MWHSLSVHLRARSFLVYVDGRLAATMPPPDFNASAPDAANFEVDGGAPLQVGRGAIYLCGRADGAVDRHFTGSVGAQRVSYTLARDWPEAPKAITQLTATQRLGGGQARGIFTLSLVAEECAPRCGRADGAVDRHVSGLEGSPKGLPLL